MSLVNDVNFQIFLFQLAMVQCFRKSMRDHVWRDVRSKNMSHLNQRFLKGLLLEEYESPSATKISYSLYIDYQTASIIVTFPGTSNTKQVQEYVTIREASMPWSPSFGAQKGFLRLYSSIREQLKLALKRALFDYEGFTIIFNGWSLGGPLCRIGAWDFLTDPSLFNPYFTSLWAQERSRQETVYVVTWGAPKAFSTKSADEYTRRFLDGFLTDYRFEITGDPIVTLPPDWTGFRHVGTRFEVTGKVMRESGFLGFERHMSYSLNIPDMFEYYEASDNAEEQ